jgi:hypothetical protein
MDTPPPSVLPFRPPNADHPAAAIPAARRMELLLDALKSAVGEARDHRLFASGKFTGLFPNRSTACAEAAHEANQLGLFETVRTESKGKQIIEWVRITPKGIAYLHDHDSPKAVLQDLKATLGATAAGIPGWMHDTREQLDELKIEFEARAGEMLTQLAELTSRVEAALRRVDAATPRLPSILQTVVPWGVTALEYLDSRREVLVTGDCSLRELFVALRPKFPEMTVPEFHAGLRRLHDNRSVQLGRAVSDGDPEYAILIGSELCDSVAR